MRPTAETAHVDDDNDDDNVARALPASAADADAMKTAGALSLRGEQLTALKMPKQMMHAFAVKEQMYDAASRPEGYISLLLAENRLMAPDVLAHFQRDRSDAFDSVLKLQYGDMFGDLELRTALSRLFRRHVFARSGGGPAGASDPANYVCAAGAGAVLNMLFSALCDAGDGVIIPAPYYPGFIFDMACRARCVPIPALLPSETRADQERYAVSEAALDAAERRCRERGARPRVLLLHHPSNPCGDLMSPHELQLAVRWARARGMHIVSDEAYALSVFARHRHEFYSIGDVCCASGLGDDIHIVWTFSKDFCMSGARCGVLYSENARLLGVMRQMSYFAGCSRDTQAVLTRMLTQESGAWVDAFIARNAERLQSAYDAAVRAMRCEFGARARVFASRAGFFLWVGFQSCMRDATATASGWAVEDALCDLFFERARVLVYPGRVLDATEPGWFRFCFSAVSEEAMLLAVRRMADALRARDGK